MNRLRDIERLLDDKLRALFRGADSGPQELIEVHRAILDDAARRIEVLPRARRRFVYSQVLVTIAVPAPERRGAYEAVFAEGRALEHDLRVRLEEEGAELPPGFTVEVRLAEELGGRPYAIEYGSAPAKPAETSAETERARAIALEIVEGTAERQRYEFAGKTRIQIGRLGDVLDSGKRIVRRNDVAFAEAEGPPNSTVSRAHAHLEWDRGTGRYRLFDDGSAFGTTVLREGRIVPVPRGAGKGIALESGDEILAGQARLRVV